MINSEFIQQLSRKAASLFPAANEARNKVEAELYNLLQTSLGKLHLVTREEFDAQCKVLAQANKRIAELEQRLGKLGS